MELIEHEFIKATRLERRICDGVHCIALLRPRLPKANAWTGVALLAGRPN